MRVIFVLYIFYVMTLFGANECIQCHKGIEDIRAKNSPMMKAILHLATKAGHKGNDCIVCHGGDPKATTKKEAHNGTVAYFTNHPGPKNFYPSPTSAWINKNTCGVCHPNQVASQYNSLMMSEAGKIQGALWSFGAKEGYNHSIGNFATHNPQDLHKRLGTKEYKAYMQKLAHLEPQGFSDTLKTLPPAPTASEVQKDPSLAVYTYLRQECLRCHTGAKGRQKRGDYRGMGCASCHIPYSNEGLYEGADPTINKKEHGHILTHQIQSSRKVQVSIGDIHYSGVPVETCSTCHNRGKRIGVSYQGLMESGYGATFDKHGAMQPKLHTKRYIHLHEDIHYQKGMLCQDCHTSNDLHGDGFLRGANAGAVEIECQDCHGTTKLYPWELPLGYSDEFNTTHATGKGRGVATNLVQYLQQGYVPKDKGDGYIITARGNPLPKAIKKGNKIVIHLASGKDITLHPLKLLKKEGKLSQNGLVAMDTIDAHTDNMECYTCHATWAPQCYGCHVKIDYSGGKQNPDYLQAAHQHDIHGITADVKNLRSYLIDGQVTETRSYLRWEDPPLAQNGEGRISPVVPGCQTTITVIGKDAEVLLQNHIYKIPNVEGAGKEGQNAIDMAPLQPHTIQKKARSCESCHSSKKALGMGILGGESVADPSKTTTIDIMDAQHRLLTKHAKEQIPATPNLKHDYSAFIDVNGTQLMTVGHHWKLSAPLSKEQRDKLDRSGLCISCHKTIPKGDLAVLAMTHIAQMTQLNIDNKEHHSIVHKILNIGAWFQILALVFIFVVLGYGIYRLFIKKKPINPRNRGWK